MITPSPTLDEAAIVERCWSCSCGWLGCYSPDEIKIHGEPDECSKCQNERIWEIDAAAIRREGVTTVGEVGRDHGGRLVREAWIRWALTRPNPKASWLVPYDDLSETDKEADRQIAEAVWAATPTPNAAADALASTMREILIEAGETIPPDGKEAAFHALGQVMRLATTALAQYDQQPGGAK